MLSTQLHLRRPGPHDFVAALYLILLFDSSMDIPASILRGFRPLPHVYLSLSAEAKMRLLVTSSVLTYGLLYALPFSYCFFCFYHKFTQ
mgnify:CR=1 FL=1